MSKDQEARDAQIARDTRAAADEPPNDNELHASGQANREKQRQADIAAGRNPDNPSGANRATDAANQPTGQSAPSGTIDGGLGGSGAGHGSGSGGAGSRGGSGGTQSGKP